MTELESILYTNLLVIFLPSIRPFAKGTIFSLKLYPTGSGKIYLLPTKPFMVEV